MKRLVICCDGTWKTSDDKNVSNIEKIARAIHTSPPDGSQQVVYYTSGVGTGATSVERLFGGAFGLGLDAAILGAYRFLALNYEEGDDVYVFGFSRGAYTARSLIGMISTIGLLTPDGVVRNDLCEAIKVYRNRPRLDQSPTQFQAAKDNVAKFRRSCYRDSQVKIKFLGVFDTVGALGVPGLSLRKYKFHDVELPNQVKYARQALAIDERRRAFAPCVWKEPEDNKKTNVKQVWFDGVHSDVGGGYRESTLGDLSLLWMIGEATKRGLVVRDDLFHSNLQPSNLPTLHNSMTFGYRIANALGAMVAWFAAMFARKDTRFHRGHRVLQVVGSETSRADWNVRIARSAFERSGNVELDNGLGTAPNASRWIEWVSETDDGDVPIEDVPAWPVVSASQHGGKKLHLVTPTEENHSPKPVSHEHTHDHERREERPRQGAQRRRVPFRRQRSPAARRVVG
ncbi:DUF2235 domain-containing protein [Antrihabitans cavernicola]|uniref:DUF2235 domain-containing protein n=1 Tax=Antrihabitans cavernicola TaxID=2495913 RepID=A0A5A7SD90_9NOCA|nr:DUF2235 domain-containing protein [Spelaeibacter cavernicola]KAA0023886.1 DUF2235 domain-containing protein [Spelaeibacter cavernicola]